MKIAVLFRMVRAMQRSVSHPFYEKLNRLLAVHGFDDFVETHCRPFYAEKMGRPSLAPGQNFRLLLLGYFEGLDSERGIAWRTADSLGVRAFLGLALTQDAPDHSTISRTRRLIDLDSHRAVFTWVLQRLGIAGLVKGKTIAIDATTLEANAALRSIVCRTASCRAISLDGFSELSINRTASRLNSGVYFLRLVIEHLLQVICPFFKVSVKPGLTQTDVVAFLPTEPKSALSYRGTIFARLADTPCLLARDSIQK